MTAQLDLFATPIESLSIEPTRDVIRRGASAEAVTAHQHVPSRRPPALTSDEEWLLALSVAEAQIRWRSWTQSHPIPLDEKPRECVGGGPGCFYDGKGVALGSWCERRYATWPALLRGLREQRAREPHVADARDLAHAFSALETYHRYYLAERPAAGTAEGPGWREEVAVPHFARLKAIIAGLGGDPTAVALAP